jgi:hypothetical protein
MMDELLAAALWLIPCAVAAIVAAIQRLKKKKPGK